MKNLLGLLASGVAAALSNTATAEQASSLGYVDAYYTADSSLNLDVPGPGLGSVDADGDGFGIRGLAKTGDVFGLYGEYQSTSYGDADLNADQLRLGVGCLPGQSGSGYFVDYVKIDLELDGQSSVVKGIGGHLRLAGEVAPSLQLFGEIGYLSLADDVEDISGFEYMVGAAFAVNRQFSLLADYRITDLETQDSDVEFKFQDLRLGARLNF